MDFCEHFEIKEVPITDSALGIDIRMYVKGVLRYTYDEEINETVRVQIKEAISLSLATLAKEGCGYEMLSHKPLDSSVMNFMNVSGFHVEKIYFTEIHPIESELSRIIEAKKALKNSPPDATKNNTQEGRVNYCNACGYDLTKRPDGIKFCPMCRNPVEKK